MAAGRPELFRAIHRNTWLLFLAMASVSAGLATSAQLGSLIIYRLTGTAVMAGLPSAITSLAVVAVGYPAGRFMDRRGRRPGLAMGFLVGAVGAALIAAAVAAGRAGVFLLAMVVFSVGIAVGQLSRAAVADMYPASQRGGAVGLVVTGGLLGGIGGPLLVSLGDHIARQTGSSPLAVPWVFVVGTFGLAAILAASLRPDPREIGLRLDEPRPGAGVVSVATSPGAGDGGLSREASVSEILGSRVTQAAMVTLACAQAAMVLIMSTASLMMSFHRHPMSTISLALMAHVTGMFALSVPVGRLADRIGRRPILMAGALLLASSGLMFTLGVHSAAVAMVAFYLVGLGWCLAFVAGSATLGDVSTPATRARVVSLSDVLTYAAAMVAAVTSGLLLSRGGEVMVGALAAALGIAPALAVLRAGRTTAPVAGAVPAEGGR
jgi:MFS family permease